ncbi:hypothetical protein [Roseibium sp.]|uniref:hypothetical protein n=1 Tax=Roseibium sp. TaxID=1936156 RepID=UPI003D11EC53
MKVIRRGPELHQTRWETQPSILDRLVVGKKREQPGFYRRMFDEDFSQLFNLRQSSNNKCFEVKSNDSALTERLLNSTSDRHTAHKLDDKIRDLVETVARTLIRFGTSYCFVQDDGEGSPIRLVFFPSTGMITAFGALLQWVPKDIENPSNPNGATGSREIRIIDQSRVMRFVLPKPIERMLSAQNRILAALDKHDLSTATLQSQVSSAHADGAMLFDMSVWEQQREKALFRATRDTGWNGRDRGSPERSDFFDCHRLIRFRRNQLILRDDILDQAGRELTRIGASIHPDYSISIAAANGQPSITCLNSLEAKLSAEEVSFNEIIDYCLRC